jgi:N-acetylneuraminic acid mutarotase
MAAAPIAGRYLHAAVWAASTNEMIVWGGVKTTTGNSAFNDGAAYNPTTNTWRLLETAPTELQGRHGFSYVYSGSEFIVWGGAGQNASGNVEYYNNGAAYNPTTKQWRMIETAPLNTGRVTKSIWSTATNEMIVWGGFSSSGGIFGTTNTYYNDGAAYNPTTKQWRLLPTSALAVRNAFGVTYINNQMLIVGGTTDTVQYSNAAFYDPTNTTTGWSTTITALSSPSYNGVIERITNTRAMYWGGTNGTTRLDVGVVIDANGSTSPQIKSVLAPASTVLPQAKRSQSTSFSDGSKMYVWGGVDVNGAVTNTGASYDPSTSTWVAMPTTTLGVRARATAVYTGAEAIFWGGYNLSQVLGDGKIYKP